MRKNQDVVIAKDQIWSDDQAGQEGRSIRIVEPPNAEHTDHVLAVLETPARWTALGTGAIGRKTRLQQANLRANYTLVSEPVDKPEVEAPAPGVASGTMDSLRMAVALDKALSALHERSARGDTVRLRRWGVENGWECQIVVGTGGDRDEYLGDGETPGAAIVDALGYTGWTA